ncbi:hypothetical protein QJQ45_020180 [Haematococcus lacustris]|nr:hypothetical protein QJQ45_020180 [Haematococcus lacustris]
MVGALWGHILKGTAAPGSSACRFCQPGHLETLTHAFLTCPAVVPAWEWVLDVYGRLTGTRPPSGDAMLLLSGRPTRGEDPPFQPPDSLLWLRLRVAYLGAVWRLRSLGAATALQPQQVARRVVEEVSTLTTAIKRDWHRVGRDISVGLCGAVPSTWFKGKDPELDAAHFDQLWPEASGGWDISDSVQFHLGLLEYLQQRGSPAWLLLLDLAGAYDNVSWGLLQDTMEAMGFCREGHVRWAQLLHRGATSQVLVNGHLTDSFPLASGLLQGSGASPLYWCIVLQPLVSYLGSLQLAGRISTPIIPSSPLAMHRAALTPALPSKEYADDLTIVVLDRVRDGKVVVEALGLFRAAGGPALSVSKSSALPCAQPEPEPGNQEGSGPEGAGRGGRGGDGGEGGGQGQVGEQVLGGGPGDGGGQGQQQGGREQGGEQEPEVVIPAVRVGVPVRHLGVPVGAASYDATSEAAFGGAAAAMMAASLPWRPINRVRRRRELQAAMQAATPGRQRHLRNQLQRLQRPPHRAAWMSLTPLILLTASPHLHPAFHLLALARAKPGVSGNLPEAGLPGLLRRIVAALRGLGCPADLTPELPLPIGPACSHIPVWGNPLLAMEDAQQPPAPFPQQAGAQALQWVAEWATTGFQELAAIPSLTNLSSLLHLCRVTQPAGRGGRVGSREWQRAVWGEEQVARSIAVAVRANPARCATGLFAMWARLPTGWQQEVARQAPLPAPADPQALQRVAVAMVMDRLGWAPAPSPIPILEGATVKCFTRVLMEPVTMLRAEANARFVKDALAGIHGDGQARQLRTHLPDIGAIEDMLPVNLD